MRPTQPQPHGRPPKQQWKGRSTAVPRAHNQTPRRRSRRPSHTTGTRLATSHGEGRQLSERLNPLLRVHLCGIGHTLAQSQFDPETVRRPAKISSSNLAPDDRATNTVTFASEDFTVKKAAHQRKRIKTAKVRTVDLGPREMCNGGGAAFLPAFFAVQHLLLKKIVKFN